MFDLITRRQEYLRAVDLPSVSKRYAVKPRFGLLYPAPLCGSFQGHDPSWHEGYTLNVVFRLESSIVGLFSSALGGV